MNLSITPVRSSAEFDRIRPYIENNPFSPCLAAEPEMWPWSSAARVAADFCAYSSSVGC